MIIGVIEGNKGENGDGDEEGLEKEWDKRSNKEEDM